MSIWLVCVFKIWTSIWWVEILKKSTWSLNQFLQTPSTFLSSLATQTCQEKKPKLKVGETNGKYVINPHLPLVSVLCLQKTILRMQMLPGGTVSNINPEIATHLAERNFTIESNSSLVEYCSGFPDSLVHMCRVSGSNFNLYGTFLISDISWDKCLIVKSNALILE